MKKVHNLKRPLYTNVDSEEIKKYNVWRNLKPEEVYYTSNKSNDYINAIYKLGEKIFGYVQLKGKKYEETFRVTQIKLDFRVY